MLCWLSSSATRIGSKSDDHSETGFKPGIIGRITRKRGSYNQNLSNQHGYATKEQNAQTRTKLYLQDMNTLKMKVNDQIFLDDTQISLTQAKQLLQWLPTSKKVFYKANGGIKELDLTTGLKNTHPFKQFPAYSNDLKLRFDSKGEHGFMTDLQTGKSTPTGELPTTLERDFRAVYWSPTEHQYVADKLLYTCAVLLDGKRE